MSRCYPVEARVVVSSPASGLEKYRDRAVEAIQRMSMRPIVMEHLTSDHCTPLEASLKLVEEADIYVGIIAFRYGSYPKGEDRSFTEFELERAKERKLDILIFQMDENYEGLSAKDVEADPEKLVKLRKLKERLVNDFVIRKFTSPDNFGFELVASLSRRRREHPRRFDGMSAIPAAPASYIAHPYSLLDVRRVVGRQYELGVLTDWIAKRDSELFDIRVINVVAIGGMGKSALTWKWFKDVVPNEMSHLAGSVWWSFYESDASFEVFVTRVLAYMTGGDVADLWDKPMKDRVEMLLEQLDRRPFLIVLDGLERLLNAYAKLDAARMEDSDLDRQTDHGVKNPIGEPSLTKEAIGKHYLRMAFDSYAQEFLRRLGSIEHSKVLITTRLFPADMQEDSGHSMAGTRMIEIKGLTPADAIDLWRGFNNSGSRENLLGLFEKFDYYPLLIAALAGLVRDYRPAPGNFDRWLKDNVDFDAFGGERKLVRKRILDFALAGLDPRGDLVLRVLSAFLMPASYDVLARLLVGPRRSIATEEEMHVVLSDLEDRGLVGWDRSSNRYDLHPVVRGMAWARLPKELRRDAYLALRRYFGMLPDPMDAQIKTFDDLAGKVQEYDSLLGLGDLDAAAAQFESCLQYFTRYRLKAFRQRRELLVALLRSSDGVFADTKSEMYGWFRLGETDVVMGRCRDAVPSLRKALAHFTATESHWTGRAHYYLGIALAGIGRFREAIDQLRLALAAYRKDRAAAEFGDALSSLAQIAHVIRWSRFGDFAEAGLIALDRGKPESSDYYTLEMLAHRHDGDLVAAQKSADKSFARAVENKLGMGEVYCALNQGEIALLRGDHKAAEERFAVVIRDAREANLHGCEVRAEIGLVRSFLARNEIERAAEHLVQARCVLNFHSMVLRDVDATNLAAKIAQRQGRFEEAMKLAKDAYRLAWCAGPPFVYIDGLDEARAILHDLGAGTPEAPEAFSSPMHSEIDDLGLDGEIETKLSVADAGAPGITNTKGWTDEQILSRIEEVKGRLDWVNTTGSARKWWLAFERENKHRCALVLRLAEELDNRKATLSEFFLAYVYSNTDNIQANLHFLDYTRLKKDAAAKATARREVALSATAEGATDSPIEASSDIPTPTSSTIAATRAVDGKVRPDETINVDIERVKEGLDWEGTTGSARKWWLAFEGENAHRPEFVLQIAEELRNRQATITEFFLAYVYSNTDDIWANLCYFDYLRLKKSEEKKRAEAAAIAKKAQEDALVANRSQEVPETNESLGLAKPASKNHIASSDVDLDGLETLTWLAPGISSTEGLSESDLRTKLASVAKQIEKGDDRARAWWRALVDENENRLHLVIRVAEEIARRGANVKDLYDAKQACKSRHILAILSYLDYDRHRNEMNTAERVEIPNVAKSLSLASWMGAFPDVRAEPDFVNCPHCQGQTPLGETCRTCRGELRRLRAQPLLLAATSGPAGVRNTFEWPDEKLDVYLDELLEVLQPLKEDVRSWWTAFRAANIEFRRYLVRLLEEVRLRGAALGDLYEAFRDAGTDVLTAILHYMDYRQRLTGPNARGRRAF